MAPVLKWGLRGLALLGVIAFGHLVIEQVSAWLNVTLMPHTEELLHRSIVIGTAVYITFTAIPFVPGAEIGLTLLTLFGGAIAPLVYLATAFSLSLAYTLGRLLPPTLLQRGFAAIGLKRAAAFIHEAADLDYDEVYRQLVPASAPAYVHYLLRFRYVALALAINMPGNVVLGGGGGLALMAGLSRLFAPIPFLLTVLIAVLPVPLAFYIGRT